MTKSELHPGWIFHCVVPSEVDRLYRCSGASMNLPRRVEHRVVVPDRIHRGKQPYQMIGGYRLWLCRGIIFMPPNERAIGHSVFELVVVTLKISLRSERESRIIVPRPGDVRNHGDLVITFQ